MDIADFFVEVAVTIPDHISGDGWFACITTRGITREAIEDGVPLRGHHVCLNNDARWFHFVTREGSEEPDLLFESRANSAHAELGQTNHVRIVATGPQALLFINDKYIEELDFSGVLKPGAIGLSVFTDIGTTPTTYRSFKIMPLRQLLGPADGLIDHQFGPNQGIDGYHPVSILVNGILEASFGSPFAQTEGDWSSGFILRRDAFDSFHVIVIGSDGYWYHGLREGDPDDEQSVAEGFTEHIATTLQATNTLRVIMNDKTGFLFINNEFIQTLDLSGLLEPGRASAITNYFTGDGLPGYSTRFEGFTIWSSDGP